MQYFGFYCLFLQSNTKNNWDIQIYRQNEYRSLVGNGAEQLIHNIFHIVHPTYTPEDVHTAKTNVYGLISGRSFEMCNII